MICLKLGDDTDVFKYILSVKKVLLYSALKRGLLGILLGRTLFARPYEAEASRAPGVEVRMNGKALCKPRELCIRAEYINDLRLQKP